jgi:NADH-quinone oxidoreductase subunit C
MSEENQNIENQQEPREESKPAFSTEERMRLYEVISGLAEGLGFTEDNTEFFTVTCIPEQWHGLALKLRKDEKTQFDFLFNVTGIDWGSHFIVVYHLESTQLKHKLVVKVKIDDRENPVVDTVCDIWATAEFHEREVFDFYGIKFKNHPDLRRIFLEDDRVGYPMRKDYVDHLNIITY